MVSLVLSVSEQKFAVESESFVGAKPEIGVDEYTVFVSGVLYSTAEVDINCLRGWGLHL